MGGDPGGYIRGFDTTVGGVWYFQAPGKFLGNKLASYGQTLDYSLRQRGSGSFFNAQDILLVGSSETLRLLNTPPRPDGTSWTQYSVTLDESAPWTLASGGTPTSTQFQSVLSNLQALRIRGEFITGTDNGDLDSVTLGMTSVPEPTGLATLCVVSEFC